MPANNARQADRPEGATFIPQVRGTAPGLICEAGGLPVAVTDTLMADAAARRRVADGTLRFAEALAG